MVGHAVFQMDGPMAFKQRRWRDGRDPHRDPYYSVQLLQVHNGSWA
ncbi:uncharacterized protein G2W53_019052 [Senna tora]|uniref:Uncharacterized protein n=1 Tax=Senna tora TaxID=362788 RepID=A0A834TTL8_9FABA|nr:uncharacterized protein G2W53_019052 [Senna tora]